MMIQVRMPMVIPAQAGMMLMNLQDPMVAVAVMMMMILMQLKCVVHVVVDQRVVVVPMVNLHVMMVLAYQVAGNVMFTGVIVLAVKMKLIVAPLLVKIKDYGIVAMDNVSIQDMFVMDQVNFVTLDGVLTVLMVQMKA